MEKIIKSATKGEEVCRIEHRVLRMPSSITKTANYSTIEGFFSDLLSVKY